MMQSGDSSNEEAPRCDPKRKDIMQKEWSKVISMLVAMEAKDGLRNCAITKKLAWHVQNEMGT